MRRRRSVFSCLAPCSLALLTTLTLTGCHDSSPSPSKPRAISNRPQSYDRFLAIIKLKEDPLLMSATRTPAGLAVNAAAAAAVEAEQKAFIAELAAISPDIEVVYTYKRILNGLTIVAPKALEERFRKLASVSYIEKASPFARPSPRAVASSDNTQGPAEDFEKASSVKWIGAKRVQDELGLTGRGVTVGIIDTGIDYTHAMFGGLGTSEAYQKQDPQSLDDGGFPNDKVVGGIDLVGTSYDASSADFSQHIPRGDADPLDEAEHGTHVAGTVAGLGNGRSTYSGVAPNASLHAIKVFGKRGSTSDAAVIAALEYAADPSGDLELDDRLDVINLSLGSEFGTPYLLYQEAARTLTKAGTVIVASAGNAGANRYIVGAPSTVDEAISVAATVDNMPHNWQFPAVAFATPSEPEILAEAVEALFSKPIDEAGNVTGPLVFVGFAATDFQAELAAALAGKVALIDRGECPFHDKVRRAYAAGAIGAVVINNVEGQPMAMGGTDEKFPIPAIMIPLAVGAKLKAGLEAGEVRIQFQTAIRIEKPELIDTITGFSSRGPRSIDGALKPEVGAPGAGIVSAKMGSGDVGVRMNGTSMAGPHVAGVAALLKERWPKAAPHVIKSAIVGTALGLRTPKGQDFAVAEQGNGRVQAFEALRTELVSEPATLSLGEVPIEGGKIVHRRINLRHLGDRARTWTVTARSSAGMTITAPASIELAAHAARSLDVTFKLDGLADVKSQEREGFLTLRSTGVPDVRIPILAVMNRTGRIEVDKLSVMASSAADAAGSAAELVVRNVGRTAASVLAFNLLGRDGRKGAALENRARNGACDLESAGWRLVPKEPASQGSLLQFAVKLYHPVTTWNVCEVSVLVDSDGDGVADQELLGTSLAALTNTPVMAGELHSFLTDAHKMRAIRQKWEIGRDTTVPQIYVEAIVDVQKYDAFAHATVAVVSVDLAKLAKTARGDVRFKLAVLSSETSSPDVDDYLGDANQWWTITPKTQGMAFYDMPRATEIAPGSSARIVLTKGDALDSLVVYMPENEVTWSDTLRDRQAKILRPSFQL